jgi:hypothetical protein
MSEREGERDRGQGGTDREWEDDQQALPVLLMNPKGGMGLTESNRLADRHKHPQSTTAVRSHGTVVSMEI